MCFVPCRLLQRVSTFPCSGSDLLHGLLAGRFGSPASVAFVSFGVLPYFTFGFLLVISCALLWIFFCHQSLRHSHNIRGSGWLMDNYVICKRLLHPLSTRFFALPRRNPNSALSHVVLEPSIVGWVLMDTHLSPLPGKFPTTNS